MSTLSSSISLLKILSTGHRSSNSNIMHWLIRGTPLGQNSVHMPSFSIPLMILFGSRSYISILQSLGSFTLCSWTRSLILIPSTVPERTILDCGISLPCPFASGSADTLGSYWRLNLYYEFLTKSVKTLKVYRLN